MRYAWRRQGAGLPFYGGPESGSECGWSVGFHPHNPGQIFATDGRVTCTLHRSTSDLVVTTKLEEQCLFGVDSITVPVHVLLAVHALDRALTRLGVLEAIVEVEGLDFATLKQAIEKEVP